MVTALTSTVVLTLADYLRVKVDYNRPPFPIPVSLVSTHPIRTWSRNDANTTDVYINETTLLPPWDGLNITSPVVQYQYVPTYLYSSALVLAAISVFLRMGFILKLVLMVFSVIAHIVVYSYLEFFQEYHDAHDDAFPAIPFELKTGLALALVVILFHVLDRQIEFTSRTDYLWKAKLKVEQEEVETMRGINKRNNL
nr:unnamed protein product [Callosobruchus chinensis]